MHPKPRSRGSGQRRGKTTKVTKDIPTNAEMLSSLDGDAPGTALLRLTEGIRIAPHTTQKNQGILSRPDTCWWIRQLQD